MLTNTHDMVNDITKILSDNSTKLWKSWPIFWMNYPFNIVIFHSYVELPKGII